MEDEDDIMSSPSSLHQLHLKQSESHCATVSNTATSPESIAPAVADDVIELTLADSSARNEGELLVGENRGELDDFDGDKSRIGGEDVEKSIRRCEDGGNDGGKVVEIGNEAIESVIVSENVEDARESVKIVSENVKIVSENVENVEKLIGGCEEGGIGEENVGNDDGMEVEMGREAVESVNTSENVDNARESVEILSENVEDARASVENVEKLISGCQEDGIGDGNVGNDEGKVVEMVNEGVEDVNASESVEIVSENVEIVSENVEIVSENVENLICGCEEGGNRDENVGNDEGKVVEMVNECQNPRESVEIVSGNVENVIDMDEGVNRENNVGTDEGKVVEMVNGAVESLNECENVRKIVEIVSENVEGKVVEMVSEVRDELNGDGVVVETVESVNIANVSENVKNVSENAEDLSDMEEKDVKVESAGQVEMVSKVREKFARDDVVVEVVERVNESKDVGNVTGNVECVSDMEKKQVEVESEVSEEGVLVETVERINESEKVENVSEHVENLSEKVENVSDMEEKEVKGEIIDQGEMVSEVPEELTQDDVAVEGGMGSENVKNVSKNVDNENYMEVKEAGVESEDQVEMSSEVREELTVDVVVLEMAEKVNVTETVENVSGMEEKEVKGESEGQGEMVSEVREELTRDDVVVEAVVGESGSAIVDNVDDMGKKLAEGENLMAVGKDEEIGEVARDTSIDANEVEGDKVMKDDGEEESVVNGDEVLVANEKVQVACEKTEAVITDELGESKAVNGGKQKEVEVPEEEVEEMDRSPVVTKINEVTVDEGTHIADLEMKPKADTKKSVGVSGGKRKRGLNSKPATPKVVTLVGEDVCFICLDGGDLVLCDRRGCPKTYHPSCIDHDDALIKFKGRWTCGWHLCNKCRKNAYSMCYTCQFSLCKACSKDAAIFRVRGNKGFCELCMKTIVMIENSEQDETGEDAFSDKSSWEYLFKDYWLEQKEKLCITSEELTLAKNQFKDSDRRQTSIEMHEGNNVAGSDSDSSHGNLESSNLKGKKAKRTSNSVDSNADSPAVTNAISGKGNSKKRLKGHTKTVNSDSDHSSPDTSRRGKKVRRLSKSRSIGVKNAAAEEPTGSNTGWASKELLEFVMHMKNGDQPVLTKFDVQDLLLEYIKRNKLRDPRRKSQIICDSMLQNLFGKPRVAHFEMAKLLELHLFLKDTGDNQGSGTDTEMRELASDNDTGLPEDDKKPKGKKSRKREQKASQSNLNDYAAIDRHNINLIFLRRNFLEALMENPETLNDKVVGSFVRIRVSGSSQKQEMYRLVQIIGTSKAAEPYKVGKRTTDVMLVVLNLNKTETISIDTISNQEFSEDECKRLRQSIKCGLINRMTVGDIVEKARAFHEVIVVNWLEAETARLTHLRDRASENGRQKELRECVEKLQLLKTPEERQRRLNEIPEIHADPKMDPSFESEDESDNSSQASGSLSRESKKDSDYISPRKGGSTSSDSRSANARTPNQKLEPNKISFGKLFEREDLVERKLETNKISEVEDGTPMSNSEGKPQVTSETSAHVEQSSVTGKTESKSSESEKIWHYRDPTGKIQGPFSTTQLRKWSKAGYFPPELKVWKISLSEIDSMLLTDMVVEKLDKELPSVGLNLNADSAITDVPSSVDTSKHTENAPSTLSENPVHAQVGNGQWTAPVGNQAPSNNGGYAGQGNITTTNMAGTPAQNARRPAPVNMPPNMMWTGPPRNPPGNTPGRGGDQRSRQLSFGGGRQGICNYHKYGHCKKGASCNYMHV